MFHCIRNLNQLGKQNYVNIAWIPGHAGVHGNEVADNVAKSGSKSKIHGPEPFITVPYASCVSTVRDWSTDRLKPTWNERKNPLEDEGACMLYVPASPFPPSQDTQESHAKSRRNLLY